MLVSPDPDFGLRALTVKAPWADQIADGSKRVEYRTWGSDYRGDVLITSAGKAVCIVRVMDCVEVAEDSWHWHLANPRALKRVAIRGQQMLWKVSVDHMRLLGLSER